MMDIEEMRRRSRGLYVFAITPFVEEGGRTLVDVEGVKRNIEFWVENRVPVVVVCGGVGELWQLDEDEHMQVVRAAVEQASGRIVVFAGVTGDTRECIAGARRLQDAGADGALLFWTGRGREALIDFYMQVSSAVDVGLMPFRIDDTVDVETIHRLADISNVVALKEESERLDDFESIVREAGDRIIIAGAGSDQLAPCFLLLGAGALTSSLANHLPTHLIEMWDAAQISDFRRVMEIQCALRPVELMRQRYGLCVNKAAMDLIGQAGGPCRAGRSRLDDDVRDELRNNLEMLGAIL